MLILDLLNRKKVLKMQTQPVNPKLEYFKYIRLIFETAFSYNDWLEHTDNDPELEGSYVALLYEKYLKEFQQRCFSYRDWCEYTYGLQFVLDNDIKDSDFDSNYEWRDMVNESLINQGWIKVINT